MEDKQPAAQPASIIRADFDQIALFSTEGWGHNRHYHDFLLRHVPQDCVYALEIGCGTGGFARRLAKRAKHMYALDLSPQMIRIAQDRSREFDNIDYQVADALTWAFPVDRYDYVASLATLHHLPLREMLSKMKAALKEGGVLVVLDLYESEGVLDTLVDVLAVPVNWTLAWIKKGGRRESQEERNANARHAKHDSFLTLAEIRRVCAEVLPGARIRRHLLWRYSIMWRKPGGAY